ncbi:excision controlling factor protein, XisI like protein (plasmid) [Picosynechococcus sp. PCC 7002]|uniref:XisI protein n=1 Tax=Picosynechococcus sp. (strain ATCC 27264 / PCC 7002 / PR-6) TaxID=32049 RepID=UPI00016DCEA3|nr:XisI protein [Picosynechococcus sp. PCC 7002]ACB00957.1 excision controlling factor protein, XisI like protein [Picosynechococcus sp. PCC 7002]
MDKLNHYRQIIQDMLNEKAKIKPIGGDIEVETVFDEKKDRYLLVHLGWNDQQRIYSCVLHLEIQEEKIWIQNNQTDQSITEELLEKGVPKIDIISGLQPAYIREHLTLETA